MTRVLVVGLRRSGTTVFWEHWRAYGAVTCFDEPFNPLIGSPPSDHRKGTRQEMLALAAADPGLWQARYAPIPPAAELRDTWSDDELAFLEYLFDAAPDVCIGETRLHTRLPSLPPALASGIHLVHLHRAPVDWALAHLMPSGSSAATRVKRAVGRASAQRRWRRFDHWQVWSTIRSDEDRFRKLAAELGIAVDDLGGWTDLELLLVYWRVLKAQVDRAASSLPFAGTSSVAFEAFCSSPASVAAEVERLVPGAAPTVAPPAVARPAREHPFDAATMRRLAEKAGFERAEDLVR